MAPDGTTTPAVAEQPSAAPRLPGLTPGRNVHFTRSYAPGTPAPEPLAAIVAKVWTPDGMVTLTVFAEDGHTFSATGVGYDPTGERGYSWRFIPRA